MTDQTATINAAMTDQTANMDVKFPGSSFDEDDAGSIADMDPAAFMQVMDQDFSEIFIDGNVLEHEASIPSDLLAVIQQYPKLSIEGNEWLAEAF